MEEPWSNENSLKLIDYYRNFPELWDAKHPLYYIKHQRMECWKELAERFETNITFVKKKICSLMGSFRAQKAKGTKLVGEGSNAKEVYVTKWFAFDRMKFLLDEGTNFQRSSANEENDATMETFEIKSENDSEIEFIDPRTIENQGNEERNSLILEHNDHSRKETIDRVPVVSITEGNESDLKVNSRNNFDNEANDCDQHYSPAVELNDLKHDVKEKNNRKRNLQESRSSGCNKMLRVEPSQSNKLDDCVTSEADTSPIVNNLDVFGQYVALKLKGYSVKTRAIAENAINNILFEADMGWYDNSFPQPKRRSPYF